METMDTVGKFEEDGISVSTVGWGTDLSGRGDGEWFETLVRGGTFDGTIERYGSRFEAEAGFERWVEKAIRDRGC